MAVAGSSPTTSAEDREGPPAPTEYQREIRGIRAPPTFLLEEFAAHIPHTWFNEFECKCRKRMPPREI
jgi:hypothetical protein